VKKIYIFLLLFLAANVFSLNIDDLKKEILNFQAKKDEILKKFEELEKTSPSDRVFKEKANFLYEIGRYKEALKAVRKIEIPDYEVIKITALSNFFSGNLTESLYNFEKIQKEAQKKHDNEILFYLAKTQEKKNLFEEATETLKKIQATPFLEKAKREIEILKHKVPGKLEELGKEIEKIVKKAPSQEEHPQAGAVILLDREFFEVFEDSTSCSEITRVIKILNDRGKRKFAEVHLDYDSTYEEVEILQACTIKENGDVIKITPQNIRDVSKYLNFPLYSNARVKIISMPEVTPGSVIYYKVKYKAKKLIANNHIVFRFGIQGFEPYLKQEFTMKIPENFNPYIRTFRRGFLKKKIRLTPKIRKKGKSRIYEWRIPEVEEIIPEDRMPSWCDIVDGFRISTFSSWDEIYSWWKGLLKGRFTRTPEMEAKVKELIKGAKTEEEKIARIYHWVASQIRYVAVEYGEAGFRPHKAEEIFQNKYGDCKDQAILLITMLDIAGIKAYPVLIGTKGVFELLEDFPELVFNHVIACVKINGNYVFLDPTSETTPFGDLPGGDQGRKVLVFDGKNWQIVKTPEFPSDKNRVLTEMHLKIGEDESLSGERIVKTFGIYDQGQRYWLKYTKPVKIKEQLQKKINSITPHGVLVDYKISDVKNLFEPCVIEMKFTGKDYLKKAGFFRLVPQWGGIGTELVAKEKRDYPIRREYATMDVDRYVLEYPEKWEVVFLPEDVIEENEYFNYSRTFRVDGNKILYEHKIETKIRDVTVEDYPKYRKLILELNEKTRNQIILKRRG